MPPRQFLAYLPFKIAHPAYLGALTADIYSYAWPIPLTLEGVRAAQANPGMPSPGSGFLAPTQARRGGAPSAKRLAPEPKEHQVGAAPESLLVRGLWC